MPPTDAPPDPLPPQNVAPAYPATSSSTLSRLLSVCIPATLVLLYLNYSRRNPASDKGVLTPPSSSSTSKQTFRDPPPDASRIAVCYTGHVGTFAEVYQQNYDALSALTTQNLSHFFVLDLVDDYTNAHTGLPIRRTHEIGALQPILDQLSASAVETFSHRDTADAGAKSSADCVRPHSSLHDDASHYAETYATLAAAARCFQMVQHAEEQSGEMFDWVVRLRPDMHVKVELPPRGTALRVHMSGIAMALVPRQLCDDFFSVVEAFQDGNCKAVDELDNELCGRYSYATSSAECLVVKWLHERGIVPSNGVYVNRKIVYPQDDI